MEAQSQQLTFIFLSGLQALGERSDPLSRVIEFGNVLGQHIQSDNFVIAQVGHIVDVGVV